MVSEDLLCNQKSGELFCLPRSHVQEQKRLAARRGWRGLDIVFLCVHGLNFPIVVFGVFDVGDGDAVDGTAQIKGCLLYTSPSPRDVEESRMPSSA